MRVHWKIRFLGGGGGGCMKEQFFLEGCESPKKGAWIVCRSKRGLGKKKEKRRDDVFEVGGGWDPNAHYELEEPYWHKYPKQITL